MPINLGECTVTVKADWSEVGAAIKKDVEAAVIREREECAQILDSLIRSEEGLLERNPGSQFTEERKKRIRCYEQIAWAIRNRVQGLSENETC